MMNKEEIKALFPNDIEAITISKNDYDRLFGEITYENIDLQARITRAIECIKDFEIQAKHINDEIYLDETLSNKLLKILGGKE